MVRRRINEDWLSSTSLSRSFRFRRGIAGNTDVMLVRTEFFPPLAIHLLGFSYRKDARSELPIRHERVDLVALTARISWTTREDHRRH
jgi:hypothetical protein